MRVTQLMFGKGYGGAERSFIDLSLALAERGYQVQAVCHPASRAARQLAGLPQIETRHLKVFGAWDSWAAWRLYRLLKDFAPQLVHAHLARAAHLGGMAARRLGIPLLVKTHTRVNFKYYRGVDFFVTTTPDQRTHLLECGVKPERIAIIPNFSALPAGTVRDAPHAPTPHIVGIGRLVPKKGFDVLLRALRELRNEGCAFSAAIGGDGPERARLERLCQRLELGDRVSFSGWIDDVGAALAAADVFVLPSRDEPFGIVVLEAMATGVPVVATRTQGPSEILSERCAFLAAPGDAGSLAAALRAALRDAALRADKARAAQRRFLEHYSREAVVAQYEAIYQRLSNGARP